MYVGYGTGHERIGFWRTQLDQQRNRWSGVAGQQPIRVAVVAPAGMDGAVCAHDNGGHWRKPDRHMDRHDQQTDAERDQLLSGEPVHSGCHGVDTQRVRKL